MEDKENKIKQDLDEGNLYVEHYTDINSIPTGILFCPVNHGENDYDTSENFIYFNRYYKDFGEVDPKDSMCFESRQKRLDIWYDLTIPYTVEEALKKFNIEYNKIICNGYKVMFETVYNLNLPFN